MAGGPGVKRCPLKPRSQGQFTGLEWTDEGGWVSGV